MTSQDISILGVLVVQSGKLPVRVQICLAILELGGMAKDGDLFDEVLQRSSMNRKGRVARLLLQSSLFSFIELSSPYGHHLLKLGTDQVAERSILSVSLLVDSVTQRLAEIREFSRVGECAENSHGLFPALQIGVVDHVPEVLCNNGTEQTHVAWHISLARQVGSLNLVNQFLTTTVGNQECVSKAILFETQISCLGEVSKHQGSCDTLLNRSISVAEKMEGVICLGTLGSSEVGQEIIAIALGAVKEARDTLVLLFPGILGRCFGFVFLLSFLGSFFGTAVGEIVLLETKIFDNLFTWVFANQSPHYLPVGLFFISLGILDSIGTNLSDVARSNIVLELLGGGRNIRVNREVGDRDLGGALLARLGGIRLEDNDLPTETKRGTDGSLEPVGGLSQGPRGVLRLILSSPEEVLVIKVLLSCGLGGIGVGVLESLHSNFAIEAGSR
ncbi:hypothetical protein HG531_006175 [Fusarium graminearum]|nr:hypothetical protein HG531_006175 [Fusarium graminearum]